MADNKTVDELLSEAAQHFESVFKQKPSCASCAPGRVNLIGEHTDYSDGFVFPMVLNTDALYSSFKHLLWSKSYARLCILKPGIPWLFFSHGIVKCFREGYKPFSL